MMNHTALHHTGISTLRNAKWSAINLLLNLRRSVFQIQSFELHLRAAIDVFLLSQVPRTDVTWLPAYSA